MITVLELDSRKKEVRRKDSSKWAMGKTLTWVDCYRPSDSDFRSISSTTGISAADFKESIEPNKRPHIFSHKDYSLIVFRGIFKKNDKFKTAPVAIFIFKKDIITIHDQQMAGLDGLRALPKDQITELFQKGAPYFIYRFMDSVVSDFFKLVNDIEENINKIEDQVILSPKEAITKDIFIQKRKMIYINKALIANREVISGIEKRYLKEFREEDVKLFRDLYNDTAQLIDVVSTYRDILTSTLDMYLSSVSNNLNKIMKTLTILTAFVMVPTLIAGIYGMNFQKVSQWNMPELYWLYGYPFALALMFAAVIIMFFWFRKKEWL